MFQYQSHHQILLPSTSSQVSSHPPIFIPQSATLTGKFYIWLLKFGSLIWSVFDYGLNIYLYQLLYTTDVVLFTDSDICISLIKYIFMLTNLLFFVHRSVFDTRTRNPSFIQNTLLYKRNKYCC